MSEARDAFAAKLNGREYGAEMTPSEEAEAKAARLLVVFGFSDDLTEFRGIIYDEAGAGSTAHLIIRTEGRWAIFEFDDENSRRPRKRPAGASIETLWCPDGLATSWLIKPSVPFAPFDIMGNGRLYCRGGRD